MRSIAFAAYYWVLSVFYALLTALFALFPGRAPMAWALSLYTRRMLWAMHWIAGIKVDVRGGERLPKGAFIIAAKHHSWGDGFVMFAHVDNLAFVTNDGLEKIPLLRGILRKFGAIVVNNCGGPEARRALADRAAAAHAEGRRILIYPEGNLAKPGERYRYRTGVFYMYRDFDLPVVPVASSLGVFWSQEDWTKRPGRAVLEFLDPIPQGLDKDEFMARLEAAVEDRTAELVAEATGRPVIPAVLDLPDDERKLADARTALEAADSAG